MRCFNGCILLGKHWVHQFKRDKHSNHTCPENLGCFEINEKSEHLELFSYSTVPLRVDNNPTTGAGSHVALSNPPQTKAIRLLRIFPTLRLNGLLECSLRTIELNGTRSHDYDALSYTWATELEAENKVKPELKCAIICNGGLLPLTENLFNCLTHLREHGYYRDLWVDAICISQCDQDERNQQVSIMADIYESAECVKVWLGAADESTSLAYELIERLGMLSEDDLRSIKPQACENEHNDKLLQHTNSPQHWASLVSFFERRWFTRAWVVQELVFARETNIMCGHHEFNWKTLVSISDHMANQLSVNTYDARCSFKKPTKLAAVKKDIEVKRDNILLRSLIRCRTYEASDPHDKVYSLLSLAQKQNGGNGLMPRYDSSISSLYTEVAKYILQNSDDLHVLAHAEGGDFRNVAGLPSWAPDWSVNKDLGLRITGYERYNAAGQEKNFRKFRDERTLVLKGFQLDIISRTGETKDEVNKSKNCEDWLGLLSELEMEYPHQDHKDAFWRTLLIDTGPRGVVPIKSPWENAFEVWMNICSHEPSDEEKKRADEFETSFTHSLNLRLFRTAGGHLGCGTTSCEVGDSIWIVQGSRVPLILRPTTFGIGEEITYNLVGGTYLHGFMQGEALEGREFHEISLV
ncbi:HET-domain-containing protein [Rostrohypoxylon terebratum]|nr:HET-domain-containing protein [Rostrohypoxylon terebratum]